MRRAAAILLLAAACSHAPPEDYRRRFLDGRWEDLKGLDPRAFCEQMRGYVEGDDPIFPDEDPRYRKLMEALRRLAPPPESLRPLLGPRGPAEEVDGRLLKRDALALCVLDSLLWRMSEKAADPRAVLDITAEAGVHFSFDPLYEASHTRTGLEVSDFFSEVVPSGETAAAIRHYLAPLLSKWRGRVTDKSTSTLFGIVLRHLGSEGAGALFAEWEGMRDPERVDLLERVGRLEGATGRVLGEVVERVADPSPETRASALKALERQEAPLDGLDASAREEDLRGALPRLRRWASEKKP